MPQPSATQPHTADGLLRRRINAFLGCLPAGVAGESEALHELRVAGRRLRLTVQLLVRKPRSRSVRRAVRRLAQLQSAVGAARDLDVILGLFTQRTRSSPSARADLRLLRRRLGGAKRRAQERTARELETPRTAKLGWALRALAVRGTAHTVTIRRRIGALRSRFGVRIGEGFARLGVSYDAEALHAVRRCARRLRYAAEVADALQGRETQAPQLWKALQDRLGAIHDHHVLGLWLLAQAQAAGDKGQASLGAVAAAEAHWAEGEARRLHRDLLADGPQRLSKRALEATGRPPTPSTRSR
jgi:CHAD domain-containing protein